MSIFGVVYLHKN